MAYQLPTREELVRSAAGTLQMAESSIAHRANNDHVKTGSDPRRASDGSSLRGAIEDEGALVVRDKMLMICRQWRATDLVNGPCEARRCTDQGIL